ncbi:MAG TPA: hypothetical protein VFK05_19765 [Polyangiaceae bacterium]|nr:hypothetical protein [Polyangiaceae bacterium]
MRKYLGLAVLAGALGAAAFGCSTSNNGPGSTFRNTGSTSSGSNTSGGSGSNFIPGSGGGPDGLNPGGPENNGGAPADADPGNPNITHAACGPGTCKDFPTMPIMGEGVTADIPAKFGDPTNFTPGTLCVLEPQLGANGKPGAMLPANWVRPRFRVAGVPAGIDILEIRLHSPMEANDLVAYTKYSAAGGVAPSWYLPKEIWTGTTPTADAASPRASGYGFANNAAGQPVTVTIRGINSSSPGMPVGIQGDFNIAPVVATGSMVFWTVNSGNVTPDSSKLLGFAVGDEGVANALTLTQVKWTGEIGEDGATLRGYYDKPKLAGFTDGQVRCIGCHTTVPDPTGGGTVLFGDDWPWSIAGAALNTGATPTAIAAGAQAIMKTPWWGQISMSVGHWKAGDHTIISSYGTTFQSGTARSIPWNKLPAYNGTDGATMDDKIKWHQLAWIDADYNAAIPVTISPDNDYGKPELDMRNTMVTAAKGTGWGLIATGDSKVSDVSPNLSHDGNSIVYVTTDYSPDGHPDATATTADIRVVPYNNRAGGTSAALAGASDANLLEYYPSFSQDDKLIAFTQAPKPGTASPDGPYYNRFGKIMVIPAAGGTATELAANDPGTCGGDNVATGIINSWAKWSPDAVHVKANNKTYYFLVFSSGRKYADEFSKQFQLPVNPLSSFKGLPQSSQLYLAAVVVDDMTGAITTYPAVYIWNQNRTPGTNGTTAAGLQYSNLTPAWDPITLPDLVIPEVPSDPIPK